MRDSMIARTVLYKVSCAFLSRVLSKKISHSRAFRLNLGTEMSLPAAINNPREKYLPAAFGFSCIIAWTQITLPGFGSATPMRGKSFDHETTPHF